MNIGTIDYEELVAVTKWAQQFFTKEYCFQFVEKDHKLILRAIMQLSSGCVIEDYPIDQLRRQGLISSKSW